MDALYISLLRLVVVCVVIAAGLWIWKRLEKWKKARRDTYDPEVIQKMTTNTVTGVGIDPCGSDDFNPEDYTDITTGASAPVGFEMDFVESRSLDFEKIRAALRADTIDAFAIPRPIVGPAESYHAVHEAGRRGWTGIGSDGHPGRDRNRDAEAIDRLGNDERRIREAITLNKIGAITDVEARDHINNTVAPGLIHPDHFSATTSVIDRDQYNQPIRPQFPNGRFIE